MKNILSLDFGGVYSLKNHIVNIEKTIYLYNSKIDAYMEYHLINNQWFYKNVKVNMNKEIIFDFTLVENEEILEKLKDN